MSSDRTEPKPKLMGVRELKTHASAIIQDAMDGQPTVVTHRGTPVAIVLPFSIDLAGLVTERSRRFLDGYRQAASDEDLEDGDDVLKELDSALNQASSQAG